MSRYAVYVDDNFHYMDESERWCAGRFDSADEAVACAARIVTKFFDEADRNLSADDLLKAYQSLGDDPFIVPLDGAPPVPFSAWDFARDLATQIQTS